jgi:arabinose operon protein AraL
MTTNTHTYHRVDEKVGVVFDLDGTLYLGEDAILGAPEAVAVLRARGHRIRFVTNNPRKSRDAYAAKLTHLGIHADAHEVLTSSNLMIRFLTQSNQAWGQLLVIGEQQIRNELEAAGFLLSPKAPADTVIVSFDTTVTYEQLTQAFLALRAGARFLATNPDVYCPTPEGGLPDAGALIAALTAATGRTPEMVVGKPSNFLGAELLRELQIAPERVVVVGDRPETDVLLGRRMGARAVLVATGASKPDLLPSEHTPDARISSVAELPACLDAWYPDGS